MVGVGVVSLLSVSAIFYITQMRKRHNDDEGKEIVYKSICLVWLSDNWNCFPAYS